MDWYRLEHSEWGIMKRILIAIAILLVSSVVYAQPPATGGNKLGWDQAASSLAEAQGYTYKYYPDSATTGTTLISITCVGATSPYQCEVAFPAFTPGNHTVTLTASNLAGESVKSAPLNFTFIVTPGAPTNLKIK
jgi:hypothetical protein